MGTISKGILGPFSGKVGPVVGSSWKGIDYMKTMPQKKSGSSTVKQIEQQLKFSTVMKFLTPFASLLEITFKKYAVEMSGINSAFAYNYQNALTGTSPDFEIDYSTALVSRGELPNAGSPAVTATNNVLHFTWTDNAGMGMAAATDKAIFVAYCAALNLVIYTIGSAARSASAGTLDTAILAGQTLETWISFISEDDKEVASSFYTGQIVL